MYLSVAGYLRSGQASRSVGRIRGGGTHVLELYELDDITRSFMVVEFDAEQLHPSVPPYRPKLLSAVGLDAFMPTIRWALRSGDDERLFSELRRPALWQATQLQVRD